MSDIATIMRTAPVIPVLVIEDAATARDTRRIAIRSIWKTTPRSTPLPR